MKTSRFIYLHNLFPALICYSQDIANWRRVFPPVFFRYHNLHLKCCRCISFVDWMRGFNLISLKKYSSVTTFAHSCFTGRKIMQNVCMLTWVHEAQSDVFSLKFPLCDSRDWTEGNDSKIRFDWRCACHNSVPREIILNRGVNLHN